MTPPATVGIVTCSALVLDVLCGQPMVKLSLLSSYQLSGIRFYGVGNEYAGIVVGFALLAAFLARSRPAVSGVLFLLLALVLGSPRLGANAGMLIAAAVGFVSGWWALKGRRAIWPAALAGALVGVAAALALAALDRAFGGSAPSHMGGALQAAGAEGWRYLARIAVRKELMNLRIIVHPGMLAAVGAVALVVLLSRRLMGPRLACFMDRHPGYCRSLGPAGWGALAALLFNDSGVVAAIFVVGVLVAAGVWLLLTDPPVPQKAAA